MITRRQGKAFVLLLGIMLALGFSSVGLAAIYYVSPNGNDSTGDGSSSTPWRSLQHAVNQASDGDTILVMETKIRMITSKTLRWTNA